MALPDYVEWMSVVVTVLMFFIVFMIYLQTSYLTLVATPNTSNFLGDPRSPKGFLSVMTGSNQDVSSRSNAHVSGFKNRHRSGFNGNELPVFWEAPSGGGMDQVSEVYSPDTEAFAGDRLKNALNGQ
jgi:hypothetical protein